MPATGSRTLSLRPRPPEITIRYNSPTSSWIHFLRDEVSPLPKEMENEITIYPSPVGFRNAKAKTNYIDSLKVLEGIPKTEREELKYGGTNEDLACWSWLKMQEEIRKKRTGILYIEKGLTSSVHMSDSVSGATQPRRG